MYPGLKDLTAFQDRWHEWCILPISELWMQKFLDTGYVERGVYTDGRVVPMEFGHSHQVLTLKKLWR